MKETILCLLAGTGIFGAIIGADWREQNLEVLTPPPYSQSQPEEDEPGWDCATMGNKICGPDVSAECEDQTYYWDRENDRLIPATRTQLGLPLCG